MLSTEHGGRRRVANAIAFNLLRDHIKTNIRTGPTGQLANSESDNAEKQTAMLRAHTNKTKKTVAQTFMV